MNRILQLIAMSVMTLALVMEGCATSYRPRGMSGGYEETPLGENLYEVRFYGNQHTSAARIRDHLLYRCAEVTLENGFDSFIITADQSYSEQTVNEPDIVIPLKTTESMSGGVITSSWSDWSQATVTSNGVGIYQILLLNSSDSDYLHSEKSRQDAKAILDRLTPSVK